jgi:hypothetical protein
MKKIAVLGMLFVLTAVHRYSSRLSGPPKERPQKGVRSQRPKITCWVRYRQDVALRSRGLRRASTHHGAI